MAAYDLAEWRAYANRLGFSKTEDAEKDYLQELMLYWLFRDKISENLILRGGTAISKLYSSGRFSEDLDFILDKEVGEEKVISAVKAAVKGMSMQYAVEVRSEKYKNMLKYVLKVRGPLFGISGSAQAVQTIGIDINLFERPLLKVKQTQRMPIYEDIPPYILNTPEAAELLADKAKALLERTEPVARDLYDAWLLCTKYNLTLDGQLAAEKMRLFGKRENEAFSTDLLKKRVASIESVWETEMKRLMSNLPEYKRVAEGFLKAL